MLDQVMWGMHGGWWVFWMTAIIVGSLFVIRSSTNQSIDIGRPSPLEILQGRYADGDISTEEYEERKAQLEQDLR